MYNVTVRTKTANEAWSAWWDLLSTQENLQGSRDGAVVGEIINATTVIEDPTRNFINSPIRKLPVRYAIGELMWYLSGSNRTADISKFSPIWKELSDDGETCNSAYGHRIHHHFGFDQWEHVKQLLTQDPNSRQAVIHIKDASNNPTKDLPCTIALQFVIREGKLHMTTHMRSNDIWKGFPYDVFCFTSMQIKMAFELGVEIGTYTHTATSLHLYERDAQDGRKNQSSN